MDGILNRIDGDGFRHLRGHYELSQERFSRILGVSTKSVVMWEKGRRPDHMARKNIKDRCGDVLLGDDYFRRYLAH